jgi:hypothetical protein
MTVEENIKEDEFLFTNRKSKVVLDGDGNVKQENKRKKKKKSEDKQRFS